MDLEPTEVQVAVAETARAFARDRVAPGAAARDRLGEAAFPADLLRELAALGLLAVNVPERFGGAAAGVVSYALAMVELAAVDPALSVTVGVTNMVGELIARWGTPAQAERCCPRLASAEWIAGAFALSEPEAGSDPASLRTRAVRRGDRWVIDGAKQWITSGDRAGVYVVWARTGPEPGSRGLSAFLVESGTPGLTAGRHEDKMGLRSSTTTALVFEGCEVPETALLGAVGQGYRIALAALDGGRIGIGAQATGTLRACLEHATRYTSERQAFGQRVADFEAVRFALADLATDHEVSRLLTLRAAALKDAGRPYRREASMAKLYASEAAQRATAKAVQLHGGYGYTDDFPVARLFRDARVQTIYEGTSEVQRMVVARELFR